MGAPKERTSRVEKVGAWLKGIDADGLIYILAMLDVIKHDFTPRDPFNRSDAARLGEFLLVETIDLAAIDASTFTEMMRLESAHTFQPPVTIVIVGATSRMASARRDQWETIEWALKIGSAEDSQVELPLPKDSVGSPKD